MFSRRRGAPRAPLFLLVTLLAPLAAGDSGAVDVASPRALDPVDYVDALRRQGTPVVGFDGVDYRVSWPGASSVCFDTPSRTARVSASGDPIDREASYVSETSPLKQVTLGGKPALVSVAYTDPSDGRIVLDRPNAAGKFVESTLVSRAAVSTVDVASWGDHLVVVYEDVDTDKTAIAVTDGTGAVVARSATLFGLVTPTVAAGPAGIVVAYVDGTSLVARRLAFDLTPLDAAPIVLAPAGAVSVTAVAGASDTLLAWQTADGLQNIVGVRVSAAGAILDPTPIAIGHGQSISGDWTGSAWVLAWTEVAPYAAEGQLHAARVGADGVVTTGASIAIPTPVGNPGIPDAVQVAKARVAAGPNGESMVVWSGASASCPTVDTPCSANDIYAQRLDATTNVASGAPIAISTQARAETARAIARGAGGYLAAWSRAGQGTVAQRLDDSGAPVGASPIALASAETAPRIAALDDEYLVTWDGVTGTLVGAGGAIRNGPFSVPGDVVAAGGGRFLVVDASGRASLLDARGAIVAGPTALTSNPFGTASAIWTGSSFLVAWSAGSKYDVYASRVEVASFALDASPPTPVLLVDSTTPDVRDGPWIAPAPGGGALVAWGEANDAQLAVVSDHGDPLVQLTLFTGGSASLALAGDAAGRALIAWHDRALVCGSGAIHAASVDFTASSIVVGAPFDVSPKGPIDSFALASDGVTGHSMVISSGSSDVAHARRVSTASIFVPVPEASVNAGAPGPAPSPDAGTSDAGVPADGGQGNGVATTSSAPSGGCGCVTAGATRTGAGSLGLALVALASLLRRRRGRGRRSA